jgi:hypothetical protein
MPVIQPAYHHARATGAERTAGSIGALPQARGANPAGAVIGLQFTFKIELDKIAPGSLAITAVSPGVMLMASP